MRTLIWSSTFLRAFRRLMRKRPDQLAPQLGTHKLKGKLSGSWACSVGYGLRIIFDFVKDEDKEEEDIFLIEIGTHDEVY